MYSTGARCRRGARRPCPGLDRRGQRKRTVRRPHSRCVTTRASGAWRPLVCCPVLCITSDLRYHSLFSSAVPARARRQRGSPLMCVSPSVHYGVPGSRCLAREERDIWGLVSAFVASGMRDCPAYAAYGSGSGGDAFEAIAGLLSIARLPPGYDPGAGYGVATAALHRCTWPLDLLVCSAARWPPRTTSSRRLTSKRTNDTCARTSRRDGAARARPGGSRRSRWSRPTTAVTTDHGRTRRSRPTTAVKACHLRTFRMRGHGPGIMNQARTARVRVHSAPSGHNLSTAVTAVVTAAAAPPGSRPGVPGAAPTRSNARWRVNGEPGLRGGDSRGGGNHQGGREGQTKRTRSPAPCRILCGMNFLVSRFRPGNSLFRICGRSDLPLRPQIVSARP